METPPAEILLLMRSGRDRQLLAEWLGSQPGYSVSTTTPDGSVPRGYDLCLLDSTGLSRCQEALGAAIEDADPVFLPHLLVAPDDEVEAALDPDDPVDEVATMPLDQQVFHRRVENLIDAREASLTLAEREEQYEQLVALTPETLLVLRDREVVYANETAAETLGVAEPAALHGPVTDLVAAESRTKLAELLGTIERGERVDEFREISLETATGETVLAEVTGVRVTFEGEPAVQLLVRDVTEQREREQRLSLFGQAIETARQGITIADARQEDEPLIYVNSGFERMTGYDASEALGRNCRFLQGTDTDASTVAQLREAIDERRPVAVELLNHRKDGTPFWNRLEVVPVRNDEGEVTHFLGLQRDVTQRRQREERLTVLDRVLRHNIRNRMNVIRSRAELLRGEVEDEAVDTILGAADDLIAITEQVREFQSLVDTDEPSLEPRDLMAVLERAVGDVQADHPDARVRLTGPDEAIAEVHQTLGPAIGQLLKFAVAGPEVDPGVTPDLHVRVRVEDGAVVLEFLDYAGTIPGDDLESIGRGSETQLHHSRGLELWLFRWAVLTSDGSLTVGERADPPESREEPVSSLRLQFRAPGGE